MESSGTPSKVECAGGCKRMISPIRCRGVYVEKYGVQYVCETCRKLPFDVVMDALRIGAVYVRGTHYKTFTELEKARQRDKEEGLRDVL